MIMGHEVDVISGPPYPYLSDQVNLIKLPGLDLFQTFSFKERLKIFLNKKDKKLIDFYEFFSTLFGGFPEMRTFGHRANNFLKINHNYDVGLDYMSVTNHFLGDIIDICEPDWSNGVNQAIQQVQYYEEIGLDHTPVDIDHIEVLVDNVLWTDWTWDEPNNKIVFTTIPPEGSIITVSYNYL